MIHSKSGAVSELWIQGNMLRDMALKIFLRIFEDEYFSEILSLGVAWPCNLTFLIPKKLPKFQPIPPMASQASAFALMLEVVGKSLEITATN
jgi:hypothetical protein